MTHNHTPNSPDRVRTKFENRAQPSQYHGFEFRCANALRITSIGPGSIPSEYSNPHQAAREVPLQQLAPTHLKRAVPPTRRKLAVVCLSGQGSHWARFAGAAKSFCVSFCFRPGVCMPGPICPGETNEGSYKCEMWLLSEWLFSCRLSPLPRY